MAGKKKGRQAQVPRQPDVSSTEHRHRASAAENECYERHHGPFHLPGVLSRSRGALQQRRTFLEICIIGSAERPARAGRMAGAV